MRARPPSIFPHEPKSVLVAVLRFDFTSRLEARLVEPMYAPELASEEEALVKELRREFHRQVQMMRDALKAADAAPSSTEPTH